MRLDCLAYSANGIRHNLQHCQRTMPTYDVEYREHCLSLSRCHQNLRAVGTPVQVSTAAEDFMAVYRALSDAKLRVRDD